MLPNTWAFYGSRWWTPAVRKAPKTDILHESVQKLHIFAFVLRRQSKQVEEIYCQLEGGLAWVGLGGSKLKLTLLRYLRAEGNFISWAPISRMCPWNFKIWKETLRFAPVCREPKKYLLYMYHSVWMNNLIWDECRWFYYNPYNQCPTGYFHQLNSLQVRLGSWVEYCSAGVLHIAQPLRLWTFQDGPANHRQDDVCRGPPIITVYPAIRIFNKHQFRFSILFSKLRPTQPPVGVSRSLSRRGAKTGKKSPTMLSRPVNRGSTCDSESIVNSFNIFMFCPKLATQTLTFCGY